MRVDEEDEPAVKGYKDADDRYAEYQGRPEQIKHRAERNEARRAETKKLGHAPTGDVAHVQPLVRGGANTLKNEKVESAAKNRSWRAGQKGYKVPLDK